MSKVIDPIGESKSDFEIFSGLAEKFDLKNDYTDNKTEKEWISPLPIKYNSNLPGYKKMIKMIPDHVNVNFPKAQAIKDATLAYFSLQNYFENKLFLHVNGSYHSDRHGDSSDGILWYLKNEAPTIKYLTISTVNQENVKKLQPENFNKADFLANLSANLS